MPLELWPLQRQAVEAYKEKGQLLLCDDVGLGKTATSLACAEWTLRQHPGSRVLITTLEPVIGHWRRHFEMMGLNADDFDLTHWQGLLERYREVCEECGGQGAVLIRDPLNIDTDAWKEDKCLACNGRGYHIRTRPKEQYAKRKPGYVLSIADEVHKGKNRKSLQTQALKAVVTPHHIGLTATLIINEPAEVWSVLNWIDKRFYSAYWRFFNAHVNHLLHRKGQCYACGKWHKREFRQILGPQNVQQFMRDLTEHMAYFARKKKGCTFPLCPKPTFQHVSLEKYTIPHDHLSELPDLMEPVILEVDLDPKQRRAYNEMRKDALAWVGAHEDQPVPAAIALTKLARLRQFAGAYMEREDHDIQDSVANMHGSSSPFYAMHEPSSKLDALMDFIEGMGGESLVVFTMFRQMVDLACVRFDKAGISYWRLDGNTPKDQRDNWNRFQQGERQVFIATIPTGGSGIELFRAATVVFLDRSWSPADNLQATGRLWRQGQKRGVQPVYINAKDTVDQQVEEKLSWKARIIKEMLGG